jgi:inosine/xanthosine triphosphatase
MSWRITSLIGLSNVTNKNASEKIIVIASENPVKIEATRSGFERMFPEDTFVIKTVQVPSGVSDQPMSDLETLTGASHRALKARITIPQANFWIGIEGGIELFQDEMIASAWVVVWNSSKVGRGKTASFTLPMKVAELIRDGKELGEADDIVFGRSNSKQANGAVGILTQDVIDRKALYEQAVVLALIPFKNPGLYSQD